MPQFLIERNFAEQLEVTKEAASAIKAGERRAKPAVGLLFSERRQEKDLLPVRSAERRGDSRGGEAFEHPGRQDH